MAVSRDVSSSLDKITLERLLLTTECTEFGQREVRGLAKSIATVPYLFCVGLPG